MAKMRSPLKNLAVWVLCGVTLGTVAAGCGSSTPTPPPPTDTGAPPPPPPPPPVVQQSQEPTAADVAAARPKDIVDPFTLPSMKSPVATQTQTVGTASPSPSASTVAKAVPTPEAPKTPPSPPTVQAVGIFSSHRGPEAILSDKSGGTIIVTTGERLKDGGYVKSIDPVSRKVVIDKEDTDFVLPLEAPAPPPSTTGK